MGTLSAQRGESYNQSADCPHWRGNLGLNVAQNGSFFCKFPFFRRMLSALFNEIGQR